MSLATGHVVQIKVSNRWTSPLVPGAVVNAGNFAMFTLEWEEGGQTKFGDFFIWSDWTDPETGANPPTPTLGDWAVREMQLAVVRDAFEEGREIGVYYFDPSPLVQTLWTGS